MAMGDALLEALLEIQRSPLHHLESPEHQLKRAAVALIIRVRPFEDIRLEEQGAAGQSLEEVFKQKWVQQGEAEVLFIKRAERKGDRWSSHVALPGN